MQCDAAEEAFCAIVLALSNRAVILANELAEIQHGQNYKGEHRQAMNPSSF
jgi:hypothetical protein